METQILTVMRILGLVLGLLGFIVFYSFFLLQKQSCLLYSKWKRNSHSKDYLLRAQEMQNSLLADIHDEVSGDLYTISTSLAICLQQEKDFYKQEILYKTLDLVQILPLKIKGVVLNSTLHETACIELSNLITVKFAELFKISQITYSYKISEVFEPLNKEELHHIYYLTHELLNNILKHSNASRVEVELTRLEASLSVFISNNGLKFNPFALTQAQQKGKGLSNIKYRLTQLGASKSYQRISGKNQIRIQIPIF